MDLKYKDRIIESVSDYLLWVKETNKTEVISDEGKPICFENNDVYYRGQSCSCWELKPSVFREPILDEHSLLSKASLKLWNEVSSLRTLHSMWHVARRAETLVMVLFFVDMVLKDEMTELQNYQQNMSLRMNCSRW